MAGKSTDNSLPSRQMLDSFGEVVLVCTAEGNIVKWNRRVNEVSGYTDEEIATMEPADFTAGEDRGLVERKIPSALSGENIRFEARIQTKADRKIPYEFTGALLEGEDGQLICLAGRNISNRRETEQTLHRHEQRLKSALEDLPVYIFNLDRDLRYTWLSHSLSEETPEELIGRPVGATLPAEDARKLVRVSREVLETGQPRRVELALTVEERERHFDFYLEARGSSGEAIGGLVGAAVDITERREAEQALRRSERKYRGVFEELGEAVVLRWEDGSVELNPAARELCRLLGYGEEDFREPDINQIYVDINEREQRVRRLEEQGVVRDFETRLQDKDGNEVIVELTSSFLPTPAGQPDGRITVMRDITARKQAEQQLRKREARYRRLFEGAQEGIAISTPEGELVDVNPAGQEILGYPEEELQEMHLEELYVDPAQRGEAIAEMTETGVLRDFQARLRRKDGREIICRLSATPRKGSEGEIQSFQTFFRDVTDRKRAQQALRASEEKFRTLAEQSLVGVVLIQKEGYEYVNPRFGEIFGYEPDELIGRSPEWIAHPEDKAKVRENVRKRLEGEVEALQYTFRGQTREGNTVYLEVFGARIAYHGRPAIIGSVLDITERRRLEREILQIQEDERRRIGQELHDGIASQLTGIIMLTEGLANDVEQDREISPDRLEQLAELLRDTNRQTRRLSRGLNPVDVQGEGLPVALEELAARTEKQSELTCTVETEGQLPEFGKETATHVYRIGQEAVNNAVKHAEARQIEVRLSSKEDRVELTVSDDGEGLPEGTDMDEGIGLRTMRYRAEMIGGHLEITRRPEGGTRVTCRLGETS